MSVEVLNIEDPTWFEDRIRLILDPYFDREFFTNLIHCIDRKKSLRDVFEASVAEIDLNGEFNEDADRALSHLFYSYQAAHALREGYQWLAMAQGLYTLGLYRGNAVKPLTLSNRESIASEATTIEEFQKSLSLEARRVSSYEKAWAGFQFLMENRSTRTKALEVLLETALYEGDLQSVVLVAKAVDASFSTGWQKTSQMLRRAFERLWDEGKDFEVSPTYKRGLSLEKSRSLTGTAAIGGEWQEDWSEELWHRASDESLESAWEWMHQLGQKGASLDQLLCASDLLRGRCLFTMKKEQWPVAMQSLVYGDAVRTAARWIPAKKSLMIACSLADVVELAQVVQVTSVDRPTGDSLREAFSGNIGKNQLVLRLDDACEKGDRDHALELLSLIVKDKGLSHSVSDRLLLMASKQDGWTYDFSSIPVAMILTSAYQEAIRLNMNIQLAHDVLYGLLRFLSDQRSSAVERVKHTGHYEDGGMYKSTFDVSSGARIVERFVFNQMRNAQRIFVWPSEGKG